MSFKPSVSTNGGIDFNENNLAFATRDEAEQSAQDLRNRWMLVTDIRVVESDQPVNYVLKDGVLSAWKSPTT